MWKYINPQEEGAQKCMIHNLKSFVNKFEHTWNNFTNTRITAWVNMSHLWALTKEMYQNFYHDYTFEQVGPQDRKGWRWTGGEELQAENQTSPLQSSSSAKKHTKQEKRQKLIQDQQVEACRLQIQTEENGSWWGVSCQADRGGAGESKEQIYWQTFFFMFEISETALHEDAINLSQLS